MLEWLPNVVLVSAGFSGGVWLISKGSDWITDSVVPMAKKLGTSNLAVGLILVSMVLSLPEIIVAALLVFAGHPAVALGVTLGSVIVNIGLIVGISALIKPLRVSRVMLLRDGIFMLTISLITVLLASDLTITKVEGMVFLLMFIPYIINVIEEEKLVPAYERQTTETHLLLSLKFAGRTEFNEYTLHTGVLAFSLGALMLVLGSKLFTDSMMGMVAIAGIPEVLLGLTLGALGPSIPNVAAGIQATKHGFEDLAVSETIGSNIFTLLVTLGFLAIITTVTIDPKEFLLTSATMIFMSFLLVFFMHKGHITRRDGAVLVGAYLGYLALQVFVF